MTPSSTGPERLSGVTAIILAAGVGSRMHAAQPKVLHPLLGRPMAIWVVEAVRSVLSDPALLLLSPATASLHALAPSGTLRAEQPQPRGTGDAVRCALPALPAGATEILIACGDTPLLEPSSISALIAARRAARAPIALAAFHAEDPTGYGRVERNDEGRAVRIVEERDATVEERANDLVNAGLYAVDRAWLESALTRLSPSAGSGEIYLTDLVAYAAAEGTSAPVLLGSGADLEGVNDRRQFADAAAALRERINGAHLDRGVGMIDPTTVWIEPTVSIAADVSIEPNVMLSGNTSIGARTRIESGSRIRESVIGEDCAIRASDIDASTIADGVDVGPFAHIRPGCTIGAGSHVGNFAELKATTLAAKVKVGHHSYLGDTSVGESSNIGAGTITANYDGEKKHATTIGAGVFTGVGTLIVAPLTMGDRSKSGAGAVVLKDVPAGALVVGVPARTVGGE
ncbi:MAG: bifunctional UDP-N-acetylglucosamine diphosphorylase/glucosamine-1-phosphate N-acetyltransferase GlmU [Candidatus Limnocylindrus sp.]